MHWKFGERSIVWKLLLMYANEKHPTFAMLSFLPVSKTWPIHTAWKSHQKILFYNIAAKMRTFLKTKKIVKFCLLFTFILTIFSELVRTPCMSKFLAFKFKMRLFFSNFGNFSVILNDAAVQLQFRICKVHLSFWKFLKEFSSVLYLHEIQF